MKKGIKLIIAATISYAIYIQFSNKMGNIWYRSNSLGKKSIQLNGLIHTIIAPLKSSSMFMWNYKFWDINYFTFTITFITLANIISK